MLRLAVRTAAVSAMAMAAPMLMSSMSVRADGEHGTLAREPAMDAANFKDFKLQKVQQVTHDTHKFTFALPKSSDELGLTVASFLLVKAEIDGKPVVRPYTPTSPVSQRGTFDLIVKSYPTGNVSKYLAGLSEGDSVAMKGPIKKFEYVPNQWRAVGMVAGGSGITPMYQLIQEILNNPRDRTEIRLIYANRTPGDIMLKAELDALAAAHPQFRVLYTVDDAAGAAWKGTRGHISKEMVTSFLPPPQAVGEDGAIAYKVLVCGPPGMMKHVSGEKKSPADQGDLTGLLADLHYAKPQVFKY